MTPPGAISRDFQQLWITAHAISQTIVANVVRPDTPTRARSLEGVSGYRLARHLQVRIVVAYNRRISEERYGTS